ncbi:MAG: hypothetical protein ACRD0B_10865, partial [Acidimicrobiales bacterium]
WRPSIERELGPGRLALRRSGGVLAAVGDDRVARVVRAGRRPGDYQDAYEALEALVAQMGLRLADMPGELEVAAVETDVGPGFELWVSHHSPLRAHGPGEGAEAGGDAPGDGAEAGGDAPDGDGGGGSEEPEG